MCILRRIVNLLVSESDVATFLGSEKYHMKANNPTDDETYFLTATILSIMEILPKNVGEKKGKTKPTNIEDAVEKKGKKPTTMRVELPTFSDDLLEKWKQQRSIVFLCNT